LHDLIVHRQRVEIFEIAIETRIPSVTLCPLAFLASSCFFSVERGFRDCSPECLEVWIDGSCRRKVTVQLSSELFNAGSSTLPTLTSEWLGDTISYLVHNFLALFLCHLLVSSIRHARFVAGLHLVQFLPAEFDGLERNTSRASISGVRHCDCVIHTSSINRTFFFGFALTTGTSG
jgi:hypothetical protein